MNLNTFRLAALAVAACGLLGACDGNDKSLLDPGTANSFNFRTDPVSAFDDRIDRMGQPAVITALMSNSPAAGTPNRQASNEANPTDDATMFLPTQVATLRRIHIELDDDLRALGLTTCTTNNPADANFLAKCGAQAVPAIAPDVITLNLDAPDGWPNGRRYDDPVVDRLLAVALLDLDVHNINILANVPLNPPGNDGVPTASNPSPSTFPNLRAAVAGP